MGLLIASEVLAARLSPALLPGLSSLSLLGLRVLCGLLHRLLLILDLRLRLSILRLLLVWKILASVDVETETVTSTGFRERALDCTVHVCASDGLVGDGLVSCIHHRQVFDVLDTLDGDTGLNPAGSPVGEVIPPFGTFVDGVGGIWEMGFHHLPRPRPGEIGQIAFLLRVLIAVHCIQRCKDTWFLHVEMGFEVEQYSKSRPPE